MTDTAFSSSRVSRRDYVLILLALAMGGFAIGISEFSTMGLMTQIAQGLQITEPQVGHVISAYALGVVVGAPLLAILGARWPRRTLLLLLMVFYALGNVASALAPSYHAMLLCRFIAGCRTAPTSALRRWWLHRSARPINVPLQWGGSCWG